MKVPAALLRELIRNMLDEEIRKVKGGYKVYPKKPRKGEKRRKALSKKPHKTYKAALSQLRAVERSKALREESGSDGGYKIPHREVVFAIDRAMSMFDIKNSELRNYLIEIARTESGGNPKGLEGITHHTRNPFQLDGGDKASIANSRTNIPLRHWRKFFSDKRKKDTGNPKALSIEDYTDEQVRGNIKSGAIFALMHVLWMTGSYKPGGDINVPADLAGRAKLWKDKYNTGAGKGLEQHYINKNS